LLSAFLPLCFLYVSLASSLCFAFVYMYSVSLWKRDRPILRSGTRSTPFRYENNPRFGTDVPNRDTLPNWAFLVTMVVTVNMKGKMGGKFDKEMNRWYCWQKTKAECYYNSRLSIFLQSSLVRMLLIFSGFIMVDV